jgi:hypothetical protein
MRIMTNGNVVEQNRQPNKQTSRVMGTKRTTPKHINKFIDN